MKKTASGKKEGAYSNRTGKRPMEAKKFGDNSSGGVSSGGGNTSQAPPPSLASHTKNSYSSVQFVTRVDVNPDANIRARTKSPEKSFNFMHDPSTSIYYQPEARNNTVLIDGSATSPTVVRPLQFNNICITTTKPSVDENGAKNNNKSARQKAEKSGKNIENERGLLITSSAENATENNSRANMQLLDVSVSATSGGNVADLLTPNSAASDVTQPQYRRKVSLMPLVTEEELKSHPMGHKDPISVAQVFGEDFASKFCVRPPLHSLSPTSFLAPKNDSAAIVLGKHSPLPYDSKDKMVRHNVSPEAALLPFEIRDKNLPTGVPTVKVRRKPVKLSLQHDLLGCSTTMAPLAPIVISDGTSAREKMTSDPASSVADDTYEVSVALSPIIPKFPSLPVSAAAAAAAATATVGVSTHFIASEHANSPFGFDTKQLEADIAAGNPDMARFQEKINDWLKKQSSILGSAFILTSNESNSCLCQVCGSDNLDEPIHCGDLDLLKSIFDFPALLNAQIVGQTTSEEKIRIQHRRQQFFDNPQLQTQPQDALAPVIDLRQLHRQNADLPLRGFCSILEHISALAHSAPSSECEDEAHTPSPSTSSPYSSSSEHMPNAVEQQQGLKHLSSTLRHAHKKHNRHATRYDTGATRLRKAKTHGSIESAENESERQRLLNDAPVNSIIGIQASCGFVAGLVLAHRDERSKAEDLEIILPHISLIATLMSIIDNVEEQKRLAQQTQRFLSMTQNVFSSLQDMNELVRNITREAKTLVQAEICSLFLLDKEHSELVAEVFEKNGTSDEYLTEIRMPLTQGIVGHVATTGNMMNVKNVYNHPYFYPKVDERTGFVTRNILCFPIKDEKGNLVGVAELCNKIGKKAFTRHDEQCAATFSVYCALSISHCLLYRKLQEAHRRSHMAAELLVQGSTLSIAPEDILRLTVRDIPSPSSFHPEFDHFSFVPRSIGTGDTYVEASLSMFKDLGFIDKYRLRRRTLARFLLMVQKGYRDVPYHNWSHAFAVGHFCYLLIRIPSVKSALTDLERFALLVACLCHDIDHRGTTNAFQLQSKTPLAQLYSSEGSVLERHHFAQTVTILGMDECNIFDQLTRQQYQNVLDCIREVILATDIAAHLRKVSHIKEMVEEGYNSQSTEHHYLLMCLLMTASDLSDQSKDFKNSKAIAENIYKEFFSQGDLEKQMGNNPIEMMDRDRACVPKIQLEFMDTVALPVFDYISRLLPDLGSTYESILMNKLCWQTLDHILQEEGHSSGSLDYLKDGELEGKVFSRLSQQEQNRGQVKAIFARSGALSAYSATKERDASNDKAADSDRAPTSSPNSSTTRSTTSATTTMES